VLTSFGTSNCLPPGLGLLLLASSVDSSLGDLVNQVSRVSLKVELVEHHLHLIHHVRNLAVVAIQLVEVDMDVLTRLLAVHPNGTVCRSELRHGVHDVVELVRVGGFGECQWQQVAQGDTPPQKLEDLVLAEGTTWGEQESGRGQLLPNCQQLLHSDDALGSRLMTAASPCLEQEYSQQSHKFMSTESSRGPATD
jgi:hypothetical protein